MKAAVIEKQGGIENIGNRDWEDPTPGDADVSESVRACGLNRLDMFVRACRDFRSQCLSQGVILPLLRKSAHRSRAGPRATV